MNLKSLVGKIFGGKTPADEYGGYPLGADASVTPVVSETFELSDIRVKQEKVSVPARDQEDPDCVLGVG